MSRSFLQLEQSAWWILVIILISVAISYFLYAKKDIPWTQAQNWLLLGLRGLAILMILFLLLEPYIKKVLNTIQKPVIALAIDNSQSVLARVGEESQVKREIDELKNNILDLGLEVQLFSLSEGDSLDFTYRTTRLSGILSSIDDEMEDQNFAGTILLSDGIYNRGSSPLYRNYIAPVFTVGMGDTIPPKDISISRTLYNKVTFKGNKTPIRFEINQEGYTEKEISFSLTENGEQIDSKSIKLNSEIQEVEFLLDLEEEGLRHIIANIPFDSEESTRENNQVDIFLEVLDARRKVLIVANAPHPDIKAIRSTLAETDNYTTDIYIPSINDEPTDIYDVVIYHGAFSSTLVFTPKGNPGKWFILSNESGISKVNKELPYLNIERRGGQPDKVTGSFNQNFSKYKIEDTEIFEEYPPIEVPYGEYSTSGPSEILMYQKLGNVTTDKPLMVVFDDGTEKSAVLLGQNIWQWKLQEAAIHENASQFKNFITKTIQFLTVENNKKQFRFEPVNKKTSDSSPIQFEAEVYNDIYERIFGNTIQLTISGEDSARQSFDFVDSRGNSTFRAPSLQPGVYSYTAQVQIGDKALSDKGEFLVENINPEFLNLTADHRLLRNLSNKTGGQFVHYNEIDLLPDLLRDMNFKYIIKSDEEFQPLIQSWWWYLIIFLLFTTEWFLRRYWGSY